MAAKLSAQLFAHQLRSAGAAVRVFRRDSGEGCVWAEFGGREIKAFFHRGGGFHIGTQLTVVEGEVPIVEELHNVTEVRRALFVGSPAAAGRVA